MTFVLYRAEVVFRQQGEALNGLEAVVWLEAVLQARIRDADHVRREVERAIGFDEVDAATSADRQQYVFKHVVDVLKNEFKFDDKDQARRFFLELRQLFTDWNYSPYNSDKFKKGEEAIAAKIKERCVNA